MPGFAAAPNARLVALYPMAANERSLVAGAAGELTSLFK
jgi:hypothetical protein